MEKTKPAPRVEQEPAQFNKTDLISSKSELFEQFFRALGELKKEKYSSYDSFFYAEQNNTIIKLSSLFYDSENKYTLEFKAERREK